MNISLKELSPPHNPNTRMLNGAAKIRYRRISEKSFFAVCTRTATLFVLGGIQRITGNFDIRFALVAMYV
jgi:hypothetical protein